MIGTYRSKNLKTGKYIERYNEHHTKPWEKSYFTFPRNLDLWNDIMKSHSLYIFVIPMIQLELQ